MRSTMAPAPLILTSVLEQAAIWPIQRRRYTIWFRFVLFPSQISVGTLCNLLKSVLIGYNPTILLILW